jgi:hypothetical protein
MRVLRSIDQLGLFHPRATTPRWTDLPAEARQQALRLLARLLRGHRRGHPIERLAREASDE